MPPTTTRKASNCVLSKNKSSKYSRLEAVISRNPDHKNTLRVARVNPAR